MGGKEWYEIGEKMKVKLDGKSKDYLNKHSTLATNAVPMAYAYTGEVGTQESILAILGKSKKNDGDLKGKWAICAVSGSEEKACFFTPGPYNAPGRPLHLDFFDQSDVNKSIVATASVTCNKAKSVFKMLFDFMIDP